MHRGERKQLSAHTAPDTVKVTHTIIHVRFDTYRLVLITEAAEQKCSNKDS